MTARPTYTAAAATRRRVQERGPYAEPDRGDASRCMGIVLLLLLINLAGAFFVFGLCFAMKGLF